jgi:hypothetical protein
MLHPVDSQTTVGTTLVPPMNLPAAQANAEHQDNNTTNPSVPTRMVVDPPTLQALIDSFNLEHKHVLETPFFSIFYECMFHLLNKYKQQGLYELFYHFKDLASLRVPPHP